MYKYLSLAIALVVTSVYAGDVDDRIAEFKSAIAKDPSDVKNLIELNRLYQQERRLDEALEYYGHIRDSYHGDEIEAVSICLSVKYLLRKGRYEDIVKQCEYVVSAFPGSMWAEECLYDLGELYLNVYSDKAEADKFFRQLINDYPESNFRSNAENYLGI